MNAHLNLVADDVHITYRSYLDPQVDLRDRLKAGRGGGRRHVKVDAVRGVSFELRAGESIGLIGHNGAGKSTLLLGLAGLLPLKRGVVLARSRPTLLGVASVLNTALSGRRNIEIGCLAMGMSKDAIHARMDELVDFAGLEDAIDLPLKAYSSGMRARLSFTVATVQTPEVLLVDEALAVGDAEFRTKATQRLGEIREAAGSVVVVSHNMSEIERMCDRVVWLDHGTVVRDGGARRLIRLYGTTRSNPELMSTLVEDESGPIGPLRPLTLLQMRENRYLSAQVEPWNIPARAELGGFPPKVPSPSPLVLEAASPAHRAELASVHEVTDRPPHATEGALLRDWLLDPATGALIAEWPSPEESRQAIVLQETLSPFVARDHTHWQSDGEILRLHRATPRADTTTSAVYCWSRWPADPLHWWTDVAARAHLASSDERLADIPVLTPPLEPWQREALGVLGVDSARRLEASAENGELCRFSKLYFTGSLTFGTRGSISLDAAVADAARVVVRRLIGNHPAEPTRRLFVPRTVGVGRRIRNEEALAVVLAEFGVESIESGASFAALVESFANAEIVIALSGGTLFGALFAPPGTPVVELQPESFSLTSGRALSGLLGHRHAILACPTVDSNSDVTSAVHDDVDVPIAELRSLLTSLLG